MYTYARNKSPLGKAENFVHPFMNVATGMISELEMRLFSLFGFEFQSPLKVISARRDGARSEVMTPSVNMGI